VRRADLPAKAKVKAKKVNPDICAAGNEIHLRFLYIYRSFLERKNRIVKKNVLILACPSLYIFPFPRKLSIAIFLENVHGI
jgi:hypothetical protein